MKHIVTFFLCLLLICLANAQVPNKISYQGLLTTSSGTPVQDGSYDIKFEIFNLPSSGTLRHSETQTGVSVQRGTFSVILGTIVTLTLAFNESLYVEVTAVNGPTGPSYPLTFLPRSELTTAPYAFRADTARYALSAPGNWASNGSDIYYNGGNVGIGTTTPNYNLDVWADDATTNDVTHVVNFVHNTTGTATNGIGVGLQFSAERAIGTQNVGLAYIDGIMTDASNVSSALAFSTRINAGSITEKMRITETGNVGIGTTTPDANAKLDVNGYAFAKAPVVVYDSAAGSGTSFNITWLNDVRLDYNIVEKQGNNYEFIFKKAGWYRISYFLFFETPTSNVAYDVLVFKNGEKYKGVSYFYTGVGGGHINSTVLVQSDGDDVINLVASSEGSHPTFNVLLNRSDLQQLAIEYLGAE